MKLSAALIIEELRKSFTLAVSCEQSLNPLLNRPILYSGESKLRDNSIYLISDYALTDHLVNPTSNALFIVLKNQYDHNISRMKNVCIIQNSIDFVTLYNFVQGVFGKYEQWYENLLQSRMEQESIAHLLELSGSVLPNSMIVLGMDFQVIASRTDRNHPFNVPAFGSTEDTYHMVNKLKKDELYNSVRELDHYFYFPADLTGFASLCVNIKRNGKTSHRLLLLEEDDEQHIHFGFLLEILAKMIEHAMAHNTMQRVSKDRSLQAVFLTLLEDRTADYVTISQRLDGLGWYSRNEYLCFTLQTSTYDQLNLTTVAICNYVENIIPFSCAFGYLEDIVVFVNMSKAEMTMVQINEKLTYFIRDSILKAGYSRIMIGHFNLRRQYVQSKIALNLGCKKHPSQWIHRFNEVSYDYILEQATKKLPGYMISHEKLLHLKTMDEINQTDYMNTLRLYLDNHLNAVKTSKQLFIHRSTFLYRLDKIKEILEVDWDNPDEILYLTLSFRFIDLEKEDPSPYSSK